jgi:hypothetical protein
VLACEEEISWIRMVGLPNIFIVLFFFLLATLLEINLFPCHEKYDISKPEWKTQVIVWGEVDREREIEKMAFLDTSEHRIVWIRKSGVIEFVDMETGIVKQSIEGVGLDLAVLDSKTGLFRQSKPVGFYCNDR